MFAPTDYTFELPPELIAQQPADRREGSRLLHVGEQLEDLAFPAIVDLLPADAIVIANDTRVIPARVLAHKPTGGNVELLFLEPVDPAALAGVAVPEGSTPWNCLARARRPLHAGQSVFVNARAPVAKPVKRPPAVTTEPDAIELPILTERRDRDDTAPGAIVVAIPGDPYAFLDRFGHVPLPPYIDRADTADDRERYQTMFAQVPGAIASPTAGLHMTPAIADAMRARGITLTSVTLHVGWGTFAPIRVNDVRDHRMHRERYAIGDDVVQLVASGRPIVSLGTTAMRALESAAIGDKQLRAGQGATELFVHPGSAHRFQIVDHLITNFHLPESTLLMLVSAFAGTERVLAAYRHAVAQRYRFFSYGDAMLLHRV